MQRVHVLNDVWDVNTLTWARMQQPTLSSDTVAVTLAGVATAANQATGNTTLSDIKGNTSTYTVLVASGSVSSQGNNTLITPASGKKIRLFYASYNPALAVELGFRFGASGTLFLRNNLAAGGSIVAKEFGAYRYVEGAIDEAFILNLSLGVTVIWNAFYIEV